MEILVQPNLDVGPNQYGQNPLVPTTHFANVDENPHDGDTTRLITVVGFEVWRIDVSAIPDGAIIKKATIRSVQKKTNAGAQSYRVGLKIEGVNYFGATYNMGTGSSYDTHNDDFLVDPTTGKEWTKLLLGRCFLLHNQLTQVQGLPRPHLTQCVILADVIPPPASYRADPETGGLRAAAEAWDDLTATAEGEGLSATVEGEGPHADAEATPPRGEVS